MRRRRIVGIVLIGSLLSGTYWVRHTGTGNWDDFFNCNEQSNNFINAHAEFDETQRAAHGAIENDRCMAKKGFEYSGGLHMACMSARTAECYSRRATAL